MSSLHFIALAETPPRLDDLDTILNPNRGFHGRDTRGDFNCVAGYLLNRGLVLVHDTEFARFSGESRYARLEFLLLEHHRPVLGPFSVATKPLGPGSSQLEVLAFLKQAFLRAIDRVALGEMDTGDTLPLRIASLLSPAARG